MLPDKIFGLFYMYGLMIAIGILCVVALLYYFGKKKNISEKFIDFIFYDAIVSIAIGFFSATLFQSFYNYLANPEAGFKFGGMTFIGGLLGAAILFLAIYFIFKKRLKDSHIIPIVSFAGCAIPLAHAFGRIGCFFAGCCYGKETDSFLGVKFPNLPNPVHPTQLYEAVFLFALFAIIFILIMKKDFKHGISLYLCAYGIFRFFIEYLRNDNRGEFVAGMSPSQFWSIIFVVISVGAYFLIEYCDKRSKQKQLTQEISSNAEEQTDEEVQRGDENA